MKTAFTPTQKKFQPLTNVILGVGFIMGGVVVILLHLYNYVLAGKNSKTIQVITEFWTRENDNQFLDGLSTQEKAELDVLR